MNKRILICDDEARTYPLLNLAKRRLEKAGFDVDWFDGLDRRKQGISDPRRFTDVLITKIRDDGCEGLVMDLGWWGYSGEGDDMLGLDVLKRLIPILPRQLPVDRIAVLSKWEDNPGVKHQLQALGIPKGNVFSKWRLERRMSEFLDVFA